MPIAKCTECHSRLDWKNQRGSKLSNFRCKCGGAYESMKYNGGRIAFGLVGESALENAGIYTDKKGTEFITAYRWSHFKRLSDVTINNNDN